MKMEGSAEAFGYTDEEWLFKENLREFVDAEVSPRCRYHPSAILLAEGW